MSQVYRQSSLDVIKEGPAAIWNQSLGEKEKALQFTVGVLNELC